MGSIPDLVQWVKDPALPQLCLGGSCGWDSIPGLGISICCSYSQKKKIKVKKIVLYGLEIVYKEIYDKFRTMVTLKRLQLGEGTLLWGFLIGSFLIRMIRT